MEAFQLLSRGGAKFDKKRFNADVKLFDKSSGKGKEKAIDIMSGELPMELDFFKYAKGAKGVSDRKKETTEENDDGLREPKGHKRKRDSESSDPLTPAPAHRVSAKGTAVPEHINTFEELKDRYGVSSHILQNVARSGYTTPTGIQAYGFPVLLESRDLAAISPTGTGKTLSYLLPLFSLLGAPSSRGSSSGTGVRALILSPTRELAQQIHNECLKLAQGRKWRIVLFSKASAATLSEKDVRDKVDLVISTPLRLVTAMQNGSMELDNVRYLVLDEADRLLDSEFLPQVEEIVAACSHEKIQKSVFSATLPAGAEKVAMGMLRNPVRLVVGLKDTPLPLIAQSLTYVANESSKFPTLTSYLSQPYNPPLLIFTSTQTRATSLHTELTLRDVPNVEALHAGMTRKEREDCLKRMRKGEVWVLVCTEVMARGMDFGGVRGVINYDFPTSVQSYVHRIGRTGRAGREGIAITYFTDEDAPHLKAIANVLLQSGSPVPEWITKLPKASKLKRREMGKVKRGDFVVGGANVGRAEAIRKRDMIEGSKRRKAKEAANPPDGSDDEAGSD